MTISHDIHSPMPRHNTNSGIHFYSLYRPAAYNPNLKWEQTATYNIGADYGFLNNRVSGSIDFYLKKTTDLLSVIDQPAGTNFGNKDPRQYRRHGESGC